jgi:transposase
MKPEKESDAASLAVIGVEVFHLVGFGANGKIVFRRRIKRLGLKDAFEKLPPCVVGMEACLIRRDGRSRGQPGVSRADRHRAASEHLSRLSRDR